MIIDRIEKDAIAARKQREKVKANLLTTLLADARSIGKEARQGAPTDAETIGVIRKYLKNADETLARTQDASHRERLDAEKDILTGYLPAQMNRSELETAIEEIVTEQPERSPKAMGAVMKALKERHEGRYDARAASEIVKAKLS